MAAHTLQLVRTKLISIPLTYIFQNVFFIWLPFQYVKPGRPTSIILRNIPYWFHYAPRVLIEYLDHESWRFFRDGLLLTFPTYRLSASFLSLPTGWSLIRASRYWSNFLSCYAISRKEKVLEFNIDDVMLGNQVQRRHTQRNIHDHLFVNVYIFTAVRQGGLGVNFGTLIGPFLLSKWVFWHTTAPRKMQYSVKNAIKKSLLRNFLIELYLPSIRRLLRRSLSHAFLTPQFIYMIFVYSQSYT